jgi:hypothetical protein
MDAHTFLSVQRGIAGEVHQTDEAATHQWHVAQLDRL